MRKQGYRVIVVGIGLVGSKMVEVLLERKKLPIKEIKILATRERDEMVAGRRFRVRKSAPEEFDGFDLAFFAGTEGASGASKVFGWEAVNRGCVVVDNGKDFRMDPRVPLVVPEVNPEALANHQGFIANPNCSTIQMVVALMPIHRVSRIRRIVVSTYQAVSGTGSKATAELAAQARAWARSRKIVAETYPVQIFGNVIPQIARLTDEMPGYCEEEVKMQRETRKIMGDSNIKVSATCVRVPVFTTHSEAINFQTRDKVTVEEVRRLLKKAPGVVVMDDAAKGVWPHPFKIGRASCRERVS
jgi:aspartate-semialdehyde dehydrogenase